MGSNPGPGPGRLFRELSRRRLSQAGLGGMGSLPSSFSGDPRRDFPWANMEQQKGQDADFPWGRELDSPVSAPSRPPPPPIDILLSTPVICQLSRLIPHSTQAHSWVQEEPGNFSSCHVPLMMLEIMQIKLMSRAKFGQAGKGKLNFKMPAVARPAWLSG